jgi:hypothetical protein
MKGQRIFQILIVIVVLIFAIFKWTSEENNNDQIDKNFKTTAGLVYENYTTFPENKYIKYKYLVDNKFFIGKTQNSTTYRHCFVGINDKFKVEYSISDPSLSRLVQTCKLNDSIALGTSLDSVKCVNCY